jgi:hypothetical protein
MTDMRTFAIAAIIVGLAMPAYAQGAGGAGPNFTNPSVKTPEQKAADEKQRVLDEKAHKDSLSRIPDKEQKFDQWGKVR